MKKESARSTAADVQGTCVYESPIGPLSLAASEKGIVKLGFLDTGGDAPSGQSKYLDLCRTQLDEYFAGRLTDFDLPLDLRGTPFQCSVWRALLLIRYGKTWSYKRVAEQIGNARSVRAVGGANHANPVAIIVPCHRVVGADGSLTGYGGGLWRKEWLLGLESRGPEAVLS